jgi:hypothetical protein
MTSITFHLLIEVKLKKAFDKPQKELDNVLRDIYCWFRTGLEQKKDFYLIKKLRKVISSH